MSVVRAFNEIVDLYTLGDSAIYYGNEKTTYELVDTRIGSLGIPEHREYRNRLAKGHGYDSEHRSLLKNLQRKQRLKRNKLGGYWIAEADPVAAFHAYTQTVSMRTLTWTVVATDGAYGPMIHLGFANWHRVAQMNPDELAELLKRCVEWETTSDPIGEDRPRAKVSDDKVLAAILFTSS